MLEYELHRLRAEEMIREAGHRRLVREVRRARRAARRSAGHASEGPVSRPNPDPSLAHAT